MQLTPEERRDELDAFITWASGEGLRVEQSAHEHKNFVFPPTETAWRAVLHRATVAKSRAFARVAVAGLVRDVGGSE